MKDFFVSYTGVDKEYATWVAELLEKEKYSVIIQAWDFRPGDNFVAKINESLRECEKLIIILSNSYLQSKWCEAEWTTKLAEQIEIKERRIIPIRIEPVELHGLLSPIVYVDIVDQTEDEAIRRIKDGVSGKVNRSSNGYPAYYNMEHREIDIDYYVENDVITYIKTCTSKALIGGRDRAHNRITWFADEEVSLIPVTTNITIEYLDLRDTNLNYNVVFDHTLQKDEEVKYCIKAVLTNKHRHFENFFSSEIITPVDELSVHLTLADSCVSKVFTQKISNSPMNIRTEPPEEHTFHSPYHWHIHKPEINFEYKIYW